MKRVKSASHSFLSKLLDRIDRVGTNELQNYLQQLAREKGFLETIFNTLQEGVLVIDRAGRILYANHGAERLLGIHEGAVGKEIGHYLREIDWSSWLRDGGMFNRDLEVFYPEPRLLNFYAVPLENRMQGSALIFHDVTGAREQTRERIESEKLRALTLLAAGVAHELGNPLNSLHIHLQLLDRDLRRFEDPAAEHLLETVEVARREVTRLDAIISQFLTALRPGQPHRELRQVNDIARDSLAFLRPELEDRDIIVETKLDENLPRIEVDPTQIQQAFYNIIKNAMQAMCAGGILRIDTSHNDTHVIIAFADNGPGIETDTAPRIFEPYFTTKKKGSGLGLFIVQRIVREHGGEMMLQSEPGRGTTARLFLPLIERRVRLLQDRPPQPSDLEEP